MDQKNCIDNAIDRDFVKVTVKSKSCLATWLPVKSNFRVCSQFLIKPNASSQNSRHRMHLPRQDSHIWGRDRDRDREGAGGEGVSFAMCLLIIAT